MTNDRDRTEISHRILTTLPKFANWANAVRTFHTPFGVIGYRQVAILWAIRYEEIPADEVTPGRLAAHHRVQRSAITRALARLEESGFILRTVDPNDGRGFRITLTATGRDVSEFVERWYIGELTEGLSSLANEEAVELRRGMDLLARLIENLDSKRAP